MNGHRISSAVICLSLLANTAFGQETPPASRIAGSIQNLESARFQIRQQAALELTAIGEPALKSLRAALTSNDEEIRHRAQSIIGKIEARLENEIYIRAPKLRLKYDNKPLHEAVADVALKTGLAFVLDAKSGREPNQLVTLDTGDVPYWEAVEKFLAAAGLTEFVDKTPPPPPKQQQEEIMIRSRGVQQRPQAKQPIRLVASKSTAAAATQSIVRVKVLDPDFPGSAVVSGSNEIKLFLDVTPAPTLEWQGTVTAEIRKAIDDRGINLVQSHLNGIDLVGDALSNDEEVQLQALVRAQGGGRRVVFSDGSQPVGPRSNPRHVPVTLLGQEQRSKILKELEGVVTAQVLTAPQALLTIENLQNASTKAPVQNGQYKIQISERKMDKAGYLQIRFRLEMPATSEMMNLALNGGGGWEVASPTEPIILFKDSNGKTIQNPSLNILDTNSDGIIQSSEYLAVVSTRGNPNNTVKFELSGRKLVSVDIPFKLKNVPLP